MKGLKRWIGHRAVGRWLDVRGGMRLLRDPLVSARTKALAIGLGIALTFVVDALELPLEAFVAALAPLVGIALDVAVDGVEFLVLPLLFAAALMPLLVRKAGPLARDGRPAA